MTPFLSEAMNVLIRAAVNTMLETKKHEELLNTTSPNFFYVVHQLMYQDAMMCLCRLTDRNRGTLNVRRLENLIPHTFEPALTLVEDRCAFARGALSSSLS